MKDLRTITRLFFKEQRRLITMTAWLLLIQCSAQVILPRMMADLVNTGIVEKRWDAMQIAALRMLLVCCAMGVSGYLIHVLGVTAGQRFSAGLRTLLYEKVQTLSVPDVEGMGVGGLVTCINSDTAVCAALLSEILQIALEPVLMTVGGTCFIWGIDRMLGCIFLFFLCAQLLLVFWFAKGTGPMFARLREQVDYTSSSLTALFSRLTLIKLMRMEQRETEKLKRQNETLKSVSFSIQKYVVLFQPTVMLVVDLAVAAILFGLNRNMALETLRLGDVLEAIAYVQQILLSVVISGHLVRFFAEASPCSERIMTLVDRQPSVADGPEEIKSSSRLELRNVTYGYAGTGKIIDKLSLSLNRGDFLALTGQVGCGKSTLAGLMTRFFDADAGEILLDGSPLKSFLLRDVRQKIALVRKDTAVVSGTFFDNLSFGRDYVGDTDIAMALDTAILSELVSSFSEGIHAHVRALTLSGGERQRLAIARALAGKPDFLLLDDCTSALDYSTEKKLLDSIRANYPEMAVLLFAQRAASAARADRVCYMRNGRIEKTGTPDELSEYFAPPQSLFSAGRREALR